MFGLKSTEARCKWEELRTLDLTGPDSSGSCCISSLEQSIASATSSAEPETEWSLISAKMKSISTLFAYCP